MFNLIDAIPQHNKIANFIEVKSATVITVKPHTQSVVP